MNTNSRLVPLIIVRGAAHAIDFYTQALGAKLLARYEHGPERRVSHADLAVAGAVFALTEGARAWNSDAPTSLGGSPVPLQLDELFARHAAVDPPAAFSTPARPKDRTTLPDSPVLRQASSGGPEAPTADGKPRSARIHLVLGPVGAGKSTFALRLARAHGAVRLTLDEWMAKLFAPDRPDHGVMEWYAERTARCIEQIWTLARALIDSGTNVVLEIGLLRRREREAFYRRVDESASDLTIHVLDAPRDVRRRRVEERNRAKGSTFSMIVPPAIFELASDVWEPPAPAECEGRDVRFIHTDD